MKKSMFVLLAVLVGVVSAEEEMPDSVGTDGVVASQGFVALTNRLSSCGVPYFARLSPTCHCKSLGSDPMLALRVCRLLQECLLSDAPKME